MDLVALHQDLTETWRRRTGTGAAAQRWLQALARRSTSLTVRVASVAATALVAATFTTSPAQAALQCGGKAVTIRGTTGNDVITGTRRVDVIFAFGGNDKIHGLGGNDRICGGAGLDQLLGDGGNDRLYGGIDYRPDGTHQRGDILTGGTGNDQIFPGIDRRPISGQALPDVVSWRTSPNPITLNMATGVARGLGRDIISGHAYRPQTSNQADRVTGSAGDDFIETYCGSDYANGGRGNDYIQADRPFYGPAAPGPSSDVVYGGPGGDTLISSDGVDRLYGGPGVDVLQEFGRAGDILIGGPGADYFMDTVAGSARGHLSGDRSDILEVTNVTNRHAPGTIDLQARTTHIDGVAGDGYINGFTIFDFVTPFTFTGAITNRPWTVIGTAAAEFVGANTGYPIRFDAGGGDDRFADAIGDDSFDGGPGSDNMLRNDGGTDTCIDVEVGIANCETVNQ